MIPWLASCPRLGNTLLRTMFKRCLGHDSFEGDCFGGQDPLRIDRSELEHVDPAPAHPELRLGDRLRRSCQDMPREEFHEEAQRSPQVYLVKSHRHPADTNPFAYVVRDGRSAVKSYRSFYQDFNGHARADASLILGDVVYGGWSGPLGGFIGCGAPVATWVNPQPALRAGDPRFFRRAERQFATDDHWTAVRPLHDASFTTLVELTARLSAEVHGLRAVCAQRQEVIEELAREASKRLEIIEALAGAGRAQ